MYLMKARIRTTCGACTGTIHKGDPITKNTYGEWVHEQCKDARNGPLRLHKKGVYK